MINRIRIQDFKSIRDITLEMGPVTVLVGRSGAGKSTILHAIRFLRNMLINPGEAHNVEGGWSRIVPADKKDSKPSFEVTFVLPSDPAAEYVFRFVLGLHANINPPKVMLRQESLYIRGKTLFSRSLSGNPSALGEQWKWEHAPALAKPPSPAHDQPMLGLFPALHDIAYAHAALSSAIGCYNFPSSALLPQPNNKPQMSPQQGLHDNGDNYRQTMAAITQDFQKADVRRSLLAALAEVNPSITSVELDSLTNPQHAIVGHHVGDVTMELGLEQESDGTRRFYAHLLALYQLPSKLLLTFEEPENAIYPGALQLLAEEFMAAPKEGRGQVLLTTHSPQLLNAFDVDMLRVVELRDGHTMVGPVSAEQREAVKQKLLTTGELLTVDDARMEAAGPVETGA